MALPNVRGDQESVTNVHDYQLGDAIGRGSFSSIRLAFHHRTKKPYAVKIISKQKLWNCNRSKSILFNETVLAPLIEHPSIIDISEIADTESHIYQFMRLAEHGDLLRKLRKTPFEISIGIKLIDQLISAVEYLHSYGICHRDIKLENILLSKHGGLKLCDFGLSTITFDGIIQGHCGSYEYSAPEAINKTEFDGFKADMWSCGVVAYAIIARKLPYNNVTDQYDFTDPVDYSPIPKELQPFIQQLLSIDPEKRPSATKCRSLPIFKSEQIRPKLPLSSLQFNNDDPSLRSLIVSRLSQVLGMQPELFNSRLSNEGFNREKLLFVLFHNKSVRNQLQHNPEAFTEEPNAAPKPKRPLFFAPPPIVNVQIHEKKQIIQQTACTVYSKLHAFLIKQKCCVSSPLSISPSIVLHRDNAEFRVSFIISDFPNSNSCSILLCADQASSKFLSYIHAYIMEKLVPRA